LGILEMVERKKNLLSVKPLLYKPIGIRYRSNTAFFSSLIN